MTSNNTSSKIDKYNHYVDKYGRKLRSYILMMVLNHQDCEDILQETLLYIWEAFDSFDQRTNFMAWASTIARYRVLDYFKRKKRHKRIFSYETIDYLEQIALADDIDDRINVLRSCMQKLPNPESKLIHLKYKDGCSVDEMASAYGLTSRRIYQLIAKAQRNLQKCIRKSLGIDRAL